MDIQDLEQAIKNGGIPAWATEETLQKVAKALNVKDGIGNLNKTIGRTGDTNPRTFIGGLNAASASTGKLGKSAEVASKAVSNLKSLAGGAAGIAGTLMQTKGRFSDLNPIIDIVANGMNSIAGSIPIVGGFFKALIGFSAEIAKLNNVILDDLLTNFMSLSKQGFNLSTDLQSIQLAALEAGVQFDVLTGAVLNNYAGMIAFGGSVDKATQRFAKSLNYLTDPTNREGFAYAMQSFGYGAEEAAEFLGEFIDRNRNSLRLQNMTDKEVAEVAFDYAKNLRVIAELTGVQVDELKAAQMAQMADGAFQSKLQQMRNQGLVDEAFAMEQFAGQLYAIDPAIASAYKEIMTFSSVATEQSALLMRTIPDLAGAFAGQDIEAARNAVAGLAKNTDALQVGTFALLDGPNALSTLIANLVPTAQTLLGIVEGGVTKEELETEQQRQIEEISKLTGNFKDLNLETATFETKLVAAGKQLTVVGANLQSQVIENLIPAMEAQLTLTADALNSLTNFIDNPAGFFKGRKGGPGFFEFDPDPGDPDNKNFSLLNNYGGGPTGGGLYMVGERGPELLRLNQGSMGHVYNHGQTKSMLRGRAGGGGVNAIQDLASKFFTDQSYMDYAGQSMALGSMGSVRLGEKGKAQQVHMGLDYDTSMSLSRAGTLELIRSLGGGYAVGYEGPYKAGSDTQARPFTQDQNTTGNEKHYDAATMAHHMAEGFKAKTGFAHTSGEQGYLELLKATQEQTKELKKIFAKVASGDGYF